jgi:probable F420-dependent oxidoreductase
LALQFSIQMPNATDGRSWLDRVRRIEDLGAYSISVPDHLGQSLPQLAPLIALAAAATVTSRVRLATTVLDNDFRHPVMLAKEIATLDLLSGGRVDLGMGAGWFEQDYEATGVATWDAPGIRVGRLWESIDLLERLLTGEHVTFRGQYFDVRAFQSHPLPIQRPIPLMIGAGGRRMLTIAAQRAKIISMIIQLRGSADRRRAAFEEQLGWITEAGGRQRSDLRLGVRVFFGEVGSPHESRRTIAERVAIASGMEVADVLTSPFGMVGDAEAIRDHFLQIHERYGISYFTLNEPLAVLIPSVIEELSS